MQVTAGVRASKISGGMHRTRPARAYPLTCAAPLKHGQTLMCSAFQLSLLSAHLSARSARPSLDSWAALPFFSQRLLLFHAPKHLCR